MVVTLISAGRGTLSSTLGLTPSVTITNADTRSFVTGSSSVAIGVTSRVTDVRGDITLSVEYLNNTQARVAASRQIPSGETITFDWASVITT